MARPVTMSQDTESVNRAMLERAYLFNVKFGPWGAEFSSIPQFVSGRDNNTDKKSAVEEMIRETIKGYDFTPGRKKEFFQLHFFKRALLELLGLFGYELEPNSPPDDDIVFFADEKPVLVAEGKDVQGLPAVSVPAQVSHQLCIFGYVSWLATRYNIKGGAGKTETDIANVIKQLNATLQLTKPKQKKAAKKRARLLRLRRLE